MSTYHYIGLIFLTLTVLAFFVPATVYACAKLWAYGTLKGKHLFHQHYPQSEENCNGYESTRPRKVEDS